jgi:hypothetical protein
MATKKLIIALVGMLFIMPAITVAKNLKEDVTMVSYEQRWLDINGTLALKNNTNEEIRNVVYQITYLDMSDNPLDYEEFTSEVQILPGMTKKIDIPAYEHGRNYHYYKTEDEFSDHPAFKIEFKLKDYNVDDDAIEKANSDGAVSTDDEVSPFFPLTLLAIIIFIIGAYVALYLVAAMMAQKRHRNVVLWILLSWIASPILTIIILLFIGDNKDNAVE